MKINNFVRMFILVIGLCTSSLYSTIGFTESEVEGIEDVVQEPIEIETTGTVFRSYVLRKQLNVFPVHKWEGHVEYNGMPIVIQLSDTTEFQNSDKTSLTLLEFMYKLGGGKKVKIEGIYEPVTSVGGIVVQVVHASFARILPN